MGVLLNTTMMLSQISFWLDGSPLFLVTVRNSTAGVWVHLHYSPVVPVWITEMQCIARADVNVRRCVQSKKAEIFCELKP